MPGPTTYTERLHVPLRWWVQATMFLAAMWYACVVAMPAWAAWSVTGVLMVAIYGLFWWVGSAKVSVDDTTLYAGDAHIPLALLGEVSPLDDEGTRRVHGVDADARAFLLTRPYLKRSVQVTLEDPADPTPYWLLSTRRPQALAEAIAAHSQRRP